jgi:hypothetical protein
MQVIGEAMAGFAGEASEGMGVHVTDDDIRYHHPTVVIRPIAIFR